MSDAFYNSATSIRQLIATTNASGSSTTLSFSSIPGNFTHLLVYLMGQQGSSPTNDCTLTFNSDTGANYDQVLFYQNNNGSPTTAAVAGGNSLGIGPLPDATSNPGLTIVEIPFYTNTNWNKVIRISNGYITQSTSVTRLTYGTFNWRSTAAITSMTFTSGGGDFIANTVAYLYGMD